MELAVVSRPASGAPLLIKTFEYSTDQLGTQKKAQLSGNAKRTCTLWQWWAIWSLLGSSQPLTMGGAARLLLCSTIHPPSPTSSTQADTGSSSPTVVLNPAPIPSYMSPSSLTSSPFHPGSISRRLHCPRDVIPINSQSLSQCGTGV